MKLGLNIFPHDSDRKSGGSITTSRDRTQNPKPKNQTLNPKPDLPTAYCPKLSSGVPATYFHPNIQVRPSCLPAPSLYATLAQVAKRPPPPPASVRTPTSQPSPAISLRQSPT